MHFLRKGRESGDYGEADIRNHFGVPALIYEKALGEIQTYRLQRVWRLGKVDLSDAIATVLAN